MNFTEFGRKILPCGTIVYSYMLCSGGYMIKITNLDTSEERCTAGVNVNRDYISVFMTNLMDNDITADNMDTFLMNELNNYFELYPPKAKRIQRKYLYL